MNPEIQNLQRQIDDLKYLLNLFIKPEKYLFPKDVSVAYQKALKTELGSFVGLYGVTPVVQPATTGTVDHSVVGGTAIKDQDTFSDGAGGTYYTISDIVKALKAVGILAK